MATRTHKMQRAALFTIAVVAAVMIGVVLVPNSPVNAVDVEQTPKGHFLAGSERSIPILMEISATLKQIDGRMANIERLLQEDAKKKPRS